MLDPQDELHLLAITAHKLSSLGYNLQAHSRRLFRMRTQEYSARFAWLSCTQQPPSCSSKTAAAVKLGYDLLQCHPKHLRCCRSLQQHTVVCIEKGPTHGRVAADLVGFLIVREMISKMWRYCRKGWQICSSLAALQRKLCCCAIQVCLLLLGRLLAVVKRKGWPGMSMRRLA